MRKLLPLATLLFVTAIQADERPSVIALNREGLRRGQQMMADASRPDPDRIEAFVLKSEGAAEEFLEGEFVQNNQGGRPPIYAYRVHSVEALTVNPMAVDSATEVRDRRGRVEGEIHVGSDMSDTLFQTPEVAIPAGGRVRLYPDNFTGGGRQRDGRLFIEGGISGLYQQDRNGRRDVTDGSISYGAGYSMNGGRMRFSVNHVVQDSEAINGKPEDRDSVVVFRFALRRAQPRR